MKGIFIRISCLLIAILFANVIMAQTITTVQGRVTGTKGPVEGVTVAEVDEDGRTVRAVKTDVEGNFVIKISNTKNKL